MVSITELGGAQAGLRLLSQRGQHGRRRPLHQGGRPPHDPDGAEYQRQLAEHTCRTVGVTCYTCHRRQPRAEDTSGSTNPGPEAMPTARCRRDADRQERTPRLSDQLCLAYPSIPFTPYLDQARHDIRVAEHGDGPARHRQPVHDQGDRVDLRADDPFQRSRSASTAPTATTPAPSANWSDQLARRG